MRSKRLHGGKSCCRGITISIDRLLLLLLLLLLVLLVFVMRLLLLLLLMLLLRLLIIVLALMLDIVLAMLRVVRLLLMLRVGLLELLGFAINGTVNLAVGRSFNAFLLALIVGTLKGRSKGRQRRSSLSQAWRQRGENCRCVDPRCGIACACCSRKYEADRIVSERSIKVALTELFVKLTSA